MVPVPIPPTCPKCNATGTLTLCDTPPHYGRWDCPTCGRWIKWEATPREARPDIRGGTVYACPDCDEKEFSIKLANSGNGGDIVCGHCGYYVSFLPIQKLQKLTPGSAI